MIIQKSHQPIETYFKNPSHQLTNLIDKVNQLRLFNQSLIGILDPKLAKHCEIVNIQDHCITIIVDKTSWATQIRFQTPDILKQLAKTQTFKSIKNLKVLIRPKDKLIKKQTRKKNTHPLSPENATLIETLAKNTDQPKLKKALQNLAQNK